LVIDDFQWVDVETPAAIDYIARHAATSGAAVLVALRTGGWEFGRAELPFA
jgi:hypothetical protein